MYEGQLLECPECKYVFLWFDPNEHNRIYNKAHPCNPIIGMVRPSAKCPKCGFYDGPNKFKRVCR